MGGLPSPGKNPFMARALLPGTTLRMDVSSSETFVTRAEGVGHCAIAVLVPTLGFWAASGRAGDARHAHSIQPEPLE